jgi:hypothetical protein
MVPIFIINLDRYFRALEVEIDVVKCSARAFGSSGFVWAVKLLQAIQDALA